MPVTGPKFGVANREVSPGAKTFVEDLDVAGAGHRLERHRTLVARNAKHIGTKLFPVTAPNPELSGKKLRCPDLGIAKSAHLGTDVVFQDAIKRVATRMPEDHAGRILLDMPEVKTGSEAAVIEVVHGVLS